MERYKKMLTMGFLNAKSKLIRQNRQNVFGLDAGLVNALDNAMMGTPTFLTINDFDVYVDENYNVYVVDIRAFR